MAVQAAYSFNRLNYIGDKAIRSGGWYPDTHVRLYDRRYAKWNARQVHEEMEVKGDVQFLAGDLLHYSYDNIAELKIKSTRYAKLGAEVYKDRNPLYLISKILISPAA